MRIFNKIETNGSHLKEVLVKMYKQETIIVVIIFVLAFALILFIPGYKLIGNIINILVFVKYQYDRRIRLLDDILKVK